MSIPKLNITVAKGLGVGLYPLDGEVFVSDENHHTVATFKIKKPELHFDGAPDCEGTTGVDYVTNMLLAKFVVKYLEEKWKTKGSPRYGDMEIQNAIQRFVS